MLLRDCLVTVGGNIVEEAPVHLSVVMAADKILLDFGHLCPNHYRPPKPLRATVDKL